MKTQWIARILLITAITLLFACKAAPVYNVHQAEFSAPRGTHHSQVEQAIIRGAKRARWIPTVLSNNKIRASYAYKNNHFRATVIITYDLDSYDINYHSSHNLKYKIIPPKDNDNFFNENNPFRSENDEGYYQPTATIHKTYNKWVMLLNKKIGAELNNLSFRTAVKHTPTKKVSTKTEVACNDRPDKNLSSKAKILKSRVNIRNGAGKRCAIVGALTKNDEVTLLGRKKNWYLIDTGHQEAWVYYSLVKLVDEFQADDQQTAPVETLTQEFPLVPPTKRITIAVIRFKTLNKEAQNIALGELVSETFTTALVNSRGFKIIEREQLDKVVKEIEMNQTGFIETTDAVEIGKILHADAIITGSVALLDGQIQLNARIIEVESAYVLSADTRTSKYTLSNINKIANEIVMKLSHKLINAKEY
jgi:TolB-like protein